MSATTSAWAVPAALAAACCYAVATATQARQARRAGSGGALTARGVVGLLADPLWLAAGTADVGGLLLHVLALRLGPVALVQPLQVTGLLFALPLDAVLERQRVSRRQLVAAAAVAAGLALFFLTATPTPAPRTAGAGPALLLGAGALGLCGLALLVPARGEGPPVRCLALALASGAAFGVASVLVDDLGRVQAERGWAGLLHPGGLAALLAAVAAGAAGVGVSQLAFHAGRLGQALPALTVADPVVAVLLALPLLGEALRLRGGAAAPAGLGAAVLLVVGGVVALARDEPPPVPAGSVASDRALGRVLPDAGWGAVYGVAVAAVAYAAQARLDRDVSPAERLAVLLASVGATALLAGLRPLLRPAREAAAGQDGDAPGAPRPSGRGAPGARVGPGQAP